MKGRIIPMNIVVRKVISLISVILLVGYITSSIELNIAYAKASDESGSYYNCKT